jgi:hypothetical protein
MSIRIEIKSSTVQEINGVGKKSNKPYSMRKQVGWAYTMDNTGAPNPFPEKIEFTLADGQEPFQPGNYTIDPSSFFVGDFNSLAIGRLVLKPVAAAAASRAAA